MRATKTDGAHFQQSAVWCFELRETHGFSDQQIKSVYLTYEPIKGNTRTWAHNTVTISSNCWLNLRWQL